MVQARKQQINDLKAYVTKYTYTVTLGTSYTNLPSGFKDSTVTKISGGDSSSPTRGIITGGSGGSVRIKLFEDGRDIVESNNVVFGRLTESGGTFRVTYKILNSGVEETVTLSGSGSIVVSMLFTEVMKFEEIPIDASIISSEIYDTFPAAITNHNLLLGLDGDDHTQYHNDARGDARYALLSNSSVSPTPNTLVKRGPTGHVEAKYLDLSDAVGEEPASGDIRVNNSFTIRTQIGDKLNQILYCGQYAGSRSVALGDMFTTQRVSLNSAERVWLRTPYIDDDGSFTRQNMVELTQTQFGIEFDSSIGENNQRFRVDHYGIAVNKSLTNKGQVRTLDGDILVAGSSTDAGVNTALLGVKTSGGDKNILVGRSEAPIGTGLPGPSNPASNTYISGATSVVLQYATTDRVKVDSTGTTITGAFAYTHGNKGGGTEHALATTSVAGFMSATDKTKIDGLPTSFITDHGLLSGLSDDDHTQYILVDGSRAFSGPISGVTGTSSSHLITKGQLDAYAQGIDWQNSVLSVGLNTPPGSPTTGDRYVIGTSPTGTWVGNENKIAEWSGADWIYITPNKGFTTQDESTGINYNYNGTAWVTMGATISHATLIGLNNDDHPQYHNDARGDARYAALVHNHTFDSLTSKPTTLSGYGITDGVITTRQVIAGNGLAGGGDLSVNRTLTVQPADSSIVVTSSGVSVGTHNQAWSTITGTPTTLSGYGITDGVIVSRQVIAGNGITGGGDLSTNRTFTVQPADSSIVVTSSGVSVGTHNQAWSTITATPTTLAGYGIADAVKISDGAVAATANKWVIRDASGGVLGTTVYGSTEVRTPLLSGGTGDLTINTPTAGKYVILDSKAGVALRYNGNNIMLASSNITLMTTLMFQYNIDGLVSHLATGSGTGKKLTVKGQNTLSGKGGTLYLYGGDGTTDSGDVEIGRGNTTLYKQTKDAHVFSVQDATVPTTIRTPLTIQRDVLWDGYTSDQITARGALHVQNPDYTDSYIRSWWDGEFLKWRLQSPNEYQYVNISTEDGFAISSMNLNVIDGNITCYNDGTFGRLRLADSLASSGQIQASDGEVLNAKGSSGSEVCLVSYNKTLTSAVFGSDGAGLRTAQTSVLAGSTSTQMVVGTSAVVETRATSVKINGTQFVEANNITPTVTGTTPTYICNASSGNRWLIQHNGVGRINLQMSNTLAGAEYEFFVWATAWVDPGPTQIAFQGVSFDVSYVERDTPGGTLKSAVLIMANVNGALGSLAYARGVCFVDGGKVYLTDMRIV